MASKTIRGQSGRTSEDTNEPVERRKHLSGKKHVEQLQNIKVVQVKGVTDSERKGKVGNSRPWKSNPKKDLRVSDLRIKVEKHSVSEKKNGETVVKEEKNGSTLRVKNDVKNGIRNRGEFEETIHQKCEEEKKSGLSKNRKSTDGGKKVEKKAPITETKQLFSVDDYLKLLRLLKINLPSGVVNLKVIERSADPDIIKDAQAIIRDLESFKLKFTVNPRLGCREVKHALNLKKKGDTQEITRIIFFGNAKDSEETLKKNWDTNASNRGHGFIMSDRYRTEPISTPAMYATAMTRSWGYLEPGQNLANITKGVRVNVQALEKMEYSDESSFRSTESSPQRFGFYFSNPADEIECLKFFHEQVTSKYDKIMYTKGNKVECGFLTGNLDFLAEARQRTGSSKYKTCTDNIIIECKGTTGHMVDKLFKKPPNGGRQVQFLKTHEHFYQAQAYMYILKSALQTSTIRAAMVVRHYHSDGSKSRDFYWNYLREEHTKEIHEMRLHCEEEALARFLAVLSLIFQKETDSLEKT
ncbi:uncharacterized protein [Hoplias malabaricus]|uniref:uncharacterized protein n=1 Tax=Hoplias malabaricus TaxID=27720 RepID=UPI0034636C44